MEKSGQAMVEFVIALFAIVIIIAAIADFVVIASRHSGIAASIRGEVGADAIASPARDADAILRDGATPAPVTSESALAANFESESESAEIPLSGALSNWEFLGSVESVTVREEVWMPPLKIGGVE